MTDIYGATPLLLAVRHRSKGIVMLLTTMPELDYDQTDLFGRNVLHWLRIQQLSSDDIHQDQLPGLLRSTFWTTRRTVFARPQPLCDICTVLLAEDKTCRYCPICLENRFINICAECFSLGGHCRDTLHVLEKCEPLIAPLEGEPDQRCDPHRFDWWYDPSDIE